MIEFVKHSVFLQGANMAADGKPPLNSVDAFFIRTLSALLFQGCGVLGAWLVWRSYNAGETCWPPSRFGHCSELLREMNVGEFYVALGLYGMVSVGLFGFGLWVMFRKDASKRRP